MDWQAENTHDTSTAAEMPPLAAPLGALRAVLGAAERLGVARSVLLAAAALETAELSDVDRAALARLEHAGANAPGYGHSRITCTSRVRAVLTKLTAEGRCTVEDVAKELAMSPRTLQRRLEREGTTFGAVCDDARRAAALEHLRNPRVAIKETAFLLGFSEPSTFYRAFRRWTGDTPANYRRALAT